MSGEGRSLGTLVAEFGLASTVRMLESAGFSHAIIDCEHGAFGLDAVAAMITAMRADEFAVYVRTATDDRTAVLRYLDMGCAGIVAPMVETLDDALRLVDRTKYRPLGRRGVSTFRAHTDFRRVRIADHMAEANRMVRSFAQIESAAGVENVVQILMEEGVDGVILGPNDLLDDLGDPGNFENPALTAALESIAAAGRSIGKTTGIITSRSELLQRAASAGMTMLTWSSDAGLLFASAQEAVGKHGRKDVDD